MGGRTGYSFVGVDIPIPGFKSRQRLGTNLDFGELRFPRRGGRHEGLRTGGLILIEVPGFPHSVCFSGGKPDWAVTVPVPTTAPIVRPPEL